jgi:transcriptional regulator with XRE-family HTH domain
MAKPPFRSTTNSEAERLFVDPGALRDIRELAGLTREQLAVRCGLSSTTLYLAEKGVVSMKTMEKMADALWAERL